jgi:hypothetical protein
MTSRTQYENEAFTAILAPFRRAPAISDETRDDETRALEMLKTAYAQFVSVAQDCAALTDIRKDQIADMLSRLDDEMPDFESWSEQISAEKMGY